MSIIDGSAAGTGRSEVQCTGGLSEYPLVVPAQGPNGFTDGAATAQVHAVIYDGSAVIDDLHWTRAVTIQ